MNYEQAAQLFEAEINKQREAQDAIHPISSSIITHILAQDIETLSEISTNILRGTYCQRDLEAIHRDKHIIRDKAKETRCQNICRRLLRHTHNQLNQTLQTPSCR